MCLLFAYTLFAVCSMLDAMHLDFSESRMCELNSLPRRWWINEIRHISPARKSIWIDLLCVNEIDSAIVIIRMKSMIQHWTHQTYFPCHMRCRTNPDFVFFFCHDFCFFAVIITKSMLNSVKNISEPFSHSYAMLLHDFVLWRNCSAQSYETNMERNK